MTGNETELSVDVGIITIKPEEYLAVTSRLERFGKCTDLNRNKHDYICQSITDSNGLKHNVAVARCLEPGKGYAHSLATDMIEELRPTWIFLVGIAGGVPALEYSLGDVLLCTRLHDFSVCCINEEAPPTFEDHGGPVHQAVKKLLEALPRHEQELADHGWNSEEYLKKNRPNIDIYSQNFNKSLYGEKKWKQTVIDSLKQNFSEPRSPKYYLGPIASSDCLVKSTSLLNIWKNTSRNLAAVEMELAGVYYAAQKHDIPLLAIRSLSDIVGYKRSFEWTQFACESAASFAICLIEAGMLPTCINPEVLSQETVSMNPVEKQITEEDSYVLLSSGSPFHPYGTLPLKNQSYITRDCDRQLKDHLQSNSFICLHGDFCSGKSSLLIRVPEILPEAWKVYQPHIDLYPSRRKGSLEKVFFIELQRVNKDIQNWISISNLLKRNKLALLIDEICKYSSQDMREFIERLYALVDHSSPDHIRIVLTIPISLDSYIEKIGLDNPKYRDRWQVVEIADFNKEELIKMLEIFPHPVADSLKRNLVLIQNYTLMKPNEVQKFCENLWNYLRGNKIPITEIDQKIHCYLENLEKV